MLIINKRKNLLLASLCIFFTILISVIFINGIASNKASYIIKLGEYKGIEIKNENITVSIEEINEKIEVELEKYVKTVEIKNRNIIQQNDVVCISYAAFCGSDIIGCLRNYYFKIGDYNFDKNIENFLMGKKVNNSYEYIQKVPENSNDKYAGQEILYDIEIKSINKYQKPDITEGFLEKNFNVSTEDEFYNYIRNSLISEKKEEVYNDMKNYILYKIYNCTKFYFSKKELNKYFLTIKKGYENNAYLNNMSLNDYIEITLNLKDNEFVDKCYEEAKIQIGYELIIEKISEISNIKVTNNEYEKKVNEMCGNYGYENMEDLLKNFPRDSIIEILIKEKVMNLLLKYSIEA